MKEKLKSYRSKQTLEHPVESLTSSLNQLSKALVEQFEKNFHTIIGPSDLFNDLYHDQSVLKTHLVDLLTGVVIVKVVNLKIKKTRQLCALKDLQKTRQTIWHPLQLR